MRKLTLFLMALSFLMATAVFAQDGKSKKITLTDAEHALVEQNSDFAFNLFRKTRDTENHVISPLSITYALGMLNNGADGITQEEISQVLSGGHQTGYADVATMNAFCRKMLTESVSLDEDTRVAIANTIYFNGGRKDISLKSAFKNAAATYYDATPSVLSFSDEATLDVINQWAKDHTDGMIGDLLKPEDLQDPNLVSLLLNAICFKGAWGKPFDELNTQNVYFDDQRRTAMMMSQTNEFRYAENDLYQSVILPYGNGSYQMTLFLPRDGKTLDDVLTVMNGTNWNAAEYQNYEVWLNMPRIETDTNQDLNDIMKSLGMGNSFENGHGFTNFCHLGNDEENSDQCWISMMRQKAHLKLDEKGTEAAAATVVSVVDKAMQRYVEFIADKPFLYIISERSTGSIFFIGQYMGEPLENPRKDINLTAEEKQLVESNNSFAFDLFRRARGNENCIMSPLSITLALGMLNNGAAGKTQQEIYDVLGFGEIGAGGINQFCRKMLSEASLLDKETSTEIANTIYVNKGEGYELQQDFVDIANKYYDATPTALNFYDDATIDVINQWGNDKTHGMITKILDKESFHCGAISYLLNALYFKGVWTKKFNTADTREEAFNGGATVPMMNKQDVFQYMENDLCQAVRLPYGNGAYLMTLFLPREGKSISDVLSTMDGHTWQFQGYGDYMVDLRMPRIKTESSTKLKKVLEDLGMSTAFSLEAEFPNFANRTAFISDMVQKASIDLDEEGTKAAAITFVELAESGVPREVTFHANRPFFYTISERSTGSIFFMGQYVGDNATAISQVEQDDMKDDNLAIYDLQGRQVNASNLKKGIYIQNGKKVLVNK